MHALAAQMMLEIECDTPDELAEWEEQEEDDEDTEITSYDVGEEALDRLAIAMGGKTMVPVLFEKIKQLIEVRAPTRARSQNLLHAYLIPYFSLVQGQTFDMTNIP